MPLVHKARPQSSAMPSTLEKERPNGGYQFSADNNSSNKNINSGQNIHNPNNKNVKNGTANITNKRNGRKSKTVYPPCETSGKRNTQQIKDTR